MGLKRLQLCESCGRGRDSFGSDKTFLNHSCEKTIVTCTKCDKQYASKLVLRRHIETIHNKKLFSCDKCPVQLKSYTNFNVHARSIHLVVVQNQIQITGKLLIKDDRVKLSWINKAHEIVDHFSDYFEHPLCDGEALGTLSAQIIEHMHSYVDKAMKKKCILDQRHNFY